MLAACARQANRAPAIGTAFAGPATLNLRKDIPSDSPIVGAAKHGDPLQIIQHRRRFIKVRTSAGVEGWTDEHLLLSSAEIATLRAFEKDVKSLPSQGVASTYEALNVHTEPDRQAPSFIQLKENEKFDVIAHRLATRSAQARKPLVPTPARKTPAKKKPRETARLAPPPIPAPPGPPRDWLELSKAPPEIQAVEAQARQPRPVPMEDWCLIRTAKGESGWVLTSKTYMAIPDDVAQYAEGHRITSYFPLSDVKDGDKVKHHWLWTTISVSGASYDFDSFRVFIWNVRRRRYETAYIERKVKGYFPVKLDKVTYGAPPKTRSGQEASNVYPGFSVCVEKKDGNRYRRSFAFLTNIVRAAGEKPCEVEAIENPQIPVDTYVASVEQQEAGNPKRSLLDRVKGGVSNLRKRWFGW
jgi:SH3-like domain-containing protein